MRSEIMQSFQSRVNTALDIDQHQQEEEEQEGKCSCTYIFVLISLTSFKMIEKMQHKSLSSKDQTAPTQTGFTQHTSYHVSLILTFLLFVCVFLSVCRRACVHIQSSGSQV